MDIYIEYAIIDNFVVDYILFLATSITLKLRARIGRLLICSAIATCIGLSVPLLCQSLPSVITTIIKLLCAPLLCLPLCVGGKMGKYGWSTLIFLAYTVLLGGILYAFLQLNSNFLPSTVALTYSSTLPVGIYLLAILLFAYMVASVFKYITNSRHTTKFEYVATFSLLANKFTVQSFLDSGNTLKYNDRAVCFVTDRYLCKRLGAIISYGIATNQLHIERVPYSTVAGKGSSVAVLIDDFCIGGCVTPVYLALTKENRAHSILINSYLAP